MSQIKREKLVLVTYYTTARSDDDLISDVILFHGKSKELARKVIIDTIKNDILSMPNDAWVLLKFLRVDEDVETSLIQKKDVINNVREALETCYCVSVSFKSDDGENVENVYCIHNVLTV